MLYIPNTKSFTDLLEEKGWTKTLIANHAWKFSWVFTQVLKKSMQRGDNEFRQYHIGGFDAVLKNSLVNGERVRFSTMVVDYLEDWNVLIRARDYITPKQKPGTTECRTHVFLKLNDSAMVAGFSKWAPAATWKPAPAIQKKAPRVLHGIYLRLAENLHRVSIDSVKARQFIETAYRNQMPLPDKKYKYSKSLKNPLGAGYYVKKNRRVNNSIASFWHCWVDTMEEGDYSPAADREGTGRFYNLLTSSPTRMRDTILVDGLPTFELDIKNSQPLIFCTLLKEYFSAGLPAKVVEFIDLCEKGLFYKSIRALVLTAEEEEVISDRDFKTAFFGKIFYSTEKRNWVWRQKFKSKFPEVSEYISTLKEEDYKDLPRQLSRKESEIMLNGVAAKLLDAGAAFYPLHDAIYATAAWVPLAKELIEAEFKLHGVGVTVKLPDGLPVPPAPDDSARVEALHADIEERFAQEATPDLDDFLDNYVGLKANVQEDEEPRAKLTEEELEALFA